MEAENKVTVESKCVPITTKDVITLNISGNALNGTLICTMNEKLKMNKDRKECNVYLKSFSTYNVKDKPNVITGVNDDFTYITDKNERETIVIPQGYYKINDVASFIIK